MDGEPHPAVKTVRTREHGLIEATRQLAPTDLAQLRGGVLEEVAGACRARDYDAVQDLIVLLDGVDARLRRLDQDGAAPSFRRRQELAAEAGPAHGGLFR